MSFILKIEDFKFSPVCKNISEQLNFEILKANHIKRKIDEESFKILNWKEENLPLLIGDIKTVTGQKLLDERLRKPILQ